MQKTVNCRRLDSNMLKLIAIVAMTADHIAWLLFPGYPAEPLPIILHIIGRLTCPVMCFFIAEGYHYTHDVKKYTARLFVLAVISHFAYVLASNDFVDWHSFIPFYYGGILNQTSVMWALAWGLVMLRVANSDKIVDRLKLFAYAGCDAWTVDNKERAIGAKTGGHVNEPVFIKG